MVHPLSGSATVKDIGFRRPPQGLSTSGGGVSTKRFTFGSAAGGTFLLREEAMLAPLLAAAFAVLAQPQHAPVPLEAEIAAVQRIARGPGEALWPGFGGAPFGTLLLERDREILLCHPTSPPGFAPAGRDPATGCARLERPRSRLPAGLLAAMPLFGPP